MCAIEPNDPFRNGTLGSEIVNIEQQFFFFLFPLIPANHGMVIGFADYDVCCPRFVRSIVERATIDWVLRFGGVIGQSHYIIAVLTLADTDVTSFTKGFQATIVFIFTMERVFDGTESICLDLKIDNDAISAV